MDAMMRTKRYWQHGDVLLHEVVRIPEGARRVEPRPLAVGEATGHAHCVVGEGVEYYEHEGVLYLRIPSGGASVTHEEHGVGVLPETIIEVGAGVREYDHFAEEARRISD